MKKLMILGLVLFLPFVFAGTTFMDNQNDFFIMGDVTPPTPVVTPGGGGGGGGGIPPECVNDSGCELGEFCFENKCYLYECDSDSDCNDTKTCWMNRCVKLFDMKIINVESPIYPGDFFNFTYYIKGVAAIHGDVAVNFWMVKDGVVVTEGFDTIYMADFDETTETTELFLPKTILPGAYNFYAEVNYDSYYARAGRVVEVEELPQEVEEPEVLITGGVIQQVGGGIKNNIFSILIILGILVLILIIIYWRKRRPNEKKTDKKLLDLEKEKAKVMESDKLEKEKRAALKQKARRRYWKRIFGGFSGFFVSTFRGLEKRSREWSRARRLRLKEKLEEGRIREAEKAKLKKREFKEKEVANRDREADRVKIINKRALEMRETEKEKRKEKLLEIKNRKIRKEKFRKDVRKYFENIKGWWVLSLDKIREKKKVLRKRIGKYKKARRLKQLKMREVEREQKLLSARKERFRLLSLRRADEERRQRELIRLKEERRKRGILRLKKSREEKRGAKLLRLIKSKLKLHNKRVTEFEKVQENIQKIERADSPKRSIFDFSRKVKAPGTKPLTSRTFISVKRGVGKGLVSFFGFLKNITSRKQNVVMNKEQDLPHKWIVKKEFMPDRFAGILPTPKRKFIQKPVFESESPDSGFWEIGKPEPKKIVSSPFPEPSVFALALTAKRKEEERAAEDEAKKRDFDEDISEISEE